ncbi:MAG: XdhC family protein [Gemmatimonadota bacterium]
MRDVLEDYAAISAADEPIGRAVVTAVSGSAPRLPGATLLATRSGKLAGSVSGGCVEAAVAAAVVESIATGAPRLETFGVSDERAWEAGLPCGGTIQVYAEPRVRPEILAAARGGEGCVVATVVETATGPPGAALVVPREGAARGAPSPPGAGDRAAATTRELQESAPDVTRVARDALAREASRTETLRSPSGGELKVFLEVFPTPPTLVVFGGAHVAAELVRLARGLGFVTVVADGRSAFLTRERFPDADRLVLGWPEGAFAQVGLTAATYVCVLTHDPKFDDPALIAALRSPARYVGAIGSRRTQAARRERLRAAGLREDEIARLRGPIGLDLGGRGPAETALAILAEMTAVRYGGSARPLGDASRSQPEEASRSNSAAVSR